MTEIRKHVWASAVSAVAMGTAAAAFAGEIRLADIRVETAAKDAYAYEELTNHLARVRGGAADSGRAGLTILLGTRAPGSSDPAEFTSYAKRVGDKLYLWGDDTPLNGNPKKRKDGGALLTCRPGTLFAVYGFLEDRLGVKWVRAGEIGIVAPRKDAVEIPDDWSWTFVPPLDEASMRSMQWRGKPGKNAKFAPAVLRGTEARVTAEHRERLQWMLRMKHWIKRRYPMSHAFTHWFDRYGEKHPEYFAVLKDGLRTLDPKSKIRVARDRVKLCVSNEAVVDRIIADWVAAGSPRDLNICPNDSANFCECPNCRALDVIVTEKDRTLEKGCCLTDRYVNFWNRIAKKAVAIRPDVQLGAYIYSAYRQPPRREKIAYPDNMVFGMVPTQEEENDKLIAAWKKAGMKTFKLRPNYLCHFGSMPRGYERFYLENFKLNYREGMVGTDYDGGPRDELSDFECYAVARAIQNPQVSFAEIESDYLSQFGPASPAMKAYYARIRERGEKWLYRVQKRCGGDKECVLDDSELYKTVMLANPVEELEGDLKVLRQAQAVPGLSPVEKERLLHREILARNAILTRRFFDGFDPSREPEGAAPDFAERALELYRFRTTECLRVPHTDWGTIYRAYPFEVKWWRQKPVRKALRKADPTMGFAE